MRIIKTLCLVIIFSLSSITAFQVSAQSGVEIAKMAKEFSISPKVLGKFSKAGLSTSDIKSGLELAKQVADSGKLKMGDAANQVLELKQGGKDWSAIAEDFDVDLPE